jgi:hypothetical protein
VRYNFFSIRSGEPLLLAEDRRKRFIVFSVVAPGLQMATGKRDAAAGVFVLFIWTSESDTSADCRGNYYKSAGYNFTATLFINIKLQN